MSELEHRVKGIILQMAQEQLSAMREAGLVHLEEGDEPDVLTEKIDPAAWYPLAKLNDWTRQVRSLIGPESLADFGRESAERLGRMGVYHQLEVTLKEQGFSLGSKLMLTFAQVSHPYTEWSYLEADPETGVLIEVTGAGDWCEEQRRITLGWVELLASKMYDRPIEASCEAPPGRVQYRVRVA